MRFWYLYPRFNFLLEGLVQMVRDSRLQLLDLLGTGNIDLCFANEDEARELLR